MTATGRSRSDDSSPTRPTIGRSGREETVSAAALEDSELRRQTVEAFQFYREVLEQGVAHLDEERRVRLVELQHEYLHRFPGTAIPRLDQRVPRR